MQMLMLFVAAAASTAPIAGLYQSHQMEVGAALELQKNGHFRYQLDYGAVSEQAEGDWTVDGTTVRLTTRPKPNAPAFELVRDDSAPPGELTMRVEPSGFGADGYRLEAIGTDASSGQKGLVRIDADGRVDSGGQRLSAIEPLVPVYGLAAGRFELGSDRGHRLLLRFHANDLGRPAFDREPLEIRDGALVLDRYQTEIRFIRVSR
jgi:hypothetical protein